MPPHERTASSASDAQTLAGTLGRADAPKFPQYHPPPTFIPPTSGEGRNLILCFDGTGEGFDDDNSNIVDLFTMLKKDDPMEQLVYYQTGFGTYTSPSIWTPILTMVSKVADMAVAWNLDSHISSGYEFIMTNYRAKDKICIFGFSRGAYVARCLAGMLHKVGLLPAANKQQISRAYKLYTKDDDVSWQQCNAFKRTFCIDIDIHFLGVWDTVASVGMVTARRLPFTTSNTVVRTFRHAIALDERRARFQVKTWTRPNAKEANLAISDKEIALMNQVSDKGALDDPEHDVIAALMQLERKYSAVRSQPTDVKEVWFAGAHTDVGGGSVKNGVKPCLSRIALRWMVREIFRTNTGIIFRSIALARNGIDPNSLYPVVLSRPQAISDPSDRIQAIPKVKASSKHAFEVSFQRESYEALLAESEEELDRKDALAPIYDNLSNTKAWWLLELLPVRHERQDAGDEWEVWHGPNVGAGRHIPQTKDQKIYVHRSVKARMEAQYANKAKYVPSVTNFDLEHVEWVD